MLKLFHRLFVICTIIFGTTAHGNPKDDSNFFYDTKTGEGLKLTDLVNCAFDRPTPDGSVVLFFPTNKGNLMAIPKNGSTGGKQFSYKRIGTTDKGFYRAYASGDVKVFVHRDKPILITIYGDDQFDARCDRLIPQFMSE